MDWRGSDRMVRRLRYQFSFLVFSMMILLLLAGSVALAGQVSTPSPNVVSESPRFGIVPADPNVGPYFSDIEVDAGESVILEALVLNEGGGPVTLDIYPANVMSGTNGGLEASWPDEELVGQATWIDLSVQEVALEPSTQIGVSVSVTVPEGTPAGQYVTTIIAQSRDILPIPGIEQWDHIIRYSMAVVILVPGDIVHGFEIDEPVFSGRSIQMSIKNTGNYLVQPTGRLKIKDLNGELVLESPIQMRSIYNGTIANLVITLPDHFPAADYTVDLDLHDPASGADASIKDAPVTVTAADDGEGVYLRQYSIEPNETEIVFANVSVTLENGGQQIDASTVTLGVFRDGELVDEFPLATNQVMLRGENLYQTRYIPADMWETGTYTFRISVLAVEPVGGQQIELLDEELGAEIVVP